MTRVVGVDLGKTACRVQVADGQHREPPLHGPGAPGLAEPDGVRRALLAVRREVRRALAASEGPALEIDVLAVAAAGALAAPDAAPALARELTSAGVARSVMITSDAVAAHVGALAGRAGTVLAVGTGSVAVGVSDAGRVTALGGWGPWLGDDGGGAWLGREAVRSVLRAREGRGPETCLTEAVARRCGDLARLPQWLQADESPARTAATLTPDVLSAAESGDEVAGGIVARAARCWADLTIGAATAATSDRVAVVGGLASAQLLVDQWRRLLPTDLEVLEAAGSALDGALILARSTDLTHESNVLRVSAVGPNGTVANGPGATTAQATAETPAETTSGVDVDELATEQVRLDLVDLDSRGADEIVRLMLEAEATVPDALRHARPELAVAVELAEQALSRGGRLIYVGAGTPGRLAALDAAECPPTFGTPADRVVAVLAGGGAATSRAVEGAEDDGQAGVRDLLALQPGPDDLVVGISASGRTPYVLSALHAAAERGCPTVAVVNNPGSPMSRAATVTVELLTGGEVLAGSTRLKAGTSQKIALNVISTGAMIGNAKTYGAWMVDVMASNEKLRRRARRILREATGASDETAEAALESAQWQTKVALVMILAAVDVEKARELLDSAGGRVREALTLAGADSAEVAP